jgi:hypothetical protein
MRRKDPSLHECNLSDTVYTRPHESYARRGELHSATVYRRQYRGIETLRQL